MARVKYCPGCLDRWSSDVRNEQGRKIENRPLHPACEKALEEAQNG